MSKYYFKNIILKNMILKKIFKKPIGEKARLSLLPEADWSHFVAFKSNGCGGSSFQSHFLNKYLFGKQKKASCDKHDYLFAAGGNWVDFLEANFVMFAKQVEDSFDQRDFIMFLLSFCYYLAVSTFGIFYFSWGDYRTVEEIIYQ